MEHMIVHALYSIYSISVSSNSSAHIKIYALTVSQTPYVDSFGEKNHSTDHNLLPPGIPNRH